MESYLFPLRLVGPRRTLDSKDTQAHWIPRDQWTWAEMASKVGLAVIEDACVAPA